MARLNFNSMDTAPSGSFEVIPDGKYVAIISDSEMKENSKKTGSYLKLTFQIVEGQYQGRNLWTNLNLFNPNEKAVEIAKGELSSICRAMSIVEIQDSAELHDRPILIKVGHGRREDNGEEANRILGYYANQAGLVPQRQSTPQKQTSMPWKKPLSAPAPAPDKREVPF